MNIDPASLESANISPVEVLSHALDQALAEHREEASFHGNFGEQGLPPFIESGIAKAIREFQEELMNWNEIWKRHADDALIIAGMDPDEIERLRLGILRMAAQDAGIPVESLLAALSCDAPHSIRDGHAVLAIHAQNIQSKAVQSKAVQNRDRHPCDDRNSTHRSHAPRLGVHHG